MEQTRDEKSTKKKIKKKYTRVASTTLRVASQHENDTARAGGAGGSRRRRGRRGQGNRAVLLDPSTD